VPEAYKEQSIEWGRGCFHAETVVMFGINICNGVIGNVLWRGGGGLRVYRRKTLVMGAGKRR